MTGGILHLKREALKQAFRQFAALPCETVSEALLEVTDGRAGGMMAFVSTPDDYFRGDQDSGIRVDHDRALVTAVTGRRAGAAVKTD